MDKNTPVDTERVDEEYLESLGIDVEFAKGFFVGEKKAGRYNFGKNKGLVTLQPVKKGAKGLKVIQTYLPYEVFKEIFIGKKEGDDKAEIRKKVDEAIQSLKTDSPATLNEENNKKGNRKKKRSGRDFRFIGEEDDYDDEYNYDDDDENDGN